MLRFNTVSTPVTEQNTESSETSSVRGSETNAKAIKNMMLKDPKITHKRLAQVLGISERGVEKITKKMRESGEIIRKGGRFGGEWEVIK